MGEWIVSLAGTPEGARLAVGLALLAAVMHAAVGAMQKGRFDPWISRASIDVFYCAAMAPFAWFVVPFPEPHVWPILALAVLVHSVYKLLQAMAYSRADFTVVYPVARGAGPLVTVIAAGSVFSETLTPLQWVGVLTLVTGIFGLAVYNLAHTPFRRAGLGLATFLAVLTGCAIAGYTTIDAYGVRAASNPFTFLAWLFFLDGFFMPALVFVKRAGLPDRELALKLLPHGLIGAAFAILSFGSIMIATRIHLVGQAAVLRETSIVFAAVIGWVVLKEPVGPRRLTLIGLIAAGAVIVQFGR